MPIAPNKPQSLSMIPTPEQEALQPPDYTPWDVASMVVNPQSLITGGLKKIGTKAVSGMLKETPKFKKIGEDLYEVMLKGEVIGKVYPSWARAGGKGWQISSSGKMRFFKTRKEAVRELVKDVEKKSIGVGGGSKLTQGLIPITSPQLKARPGKKMGENLYVHKNYAKEAGIPQDALSKAKANLPKDFNYTAIKYNDKDKTFSFIHSPDFDTAAEPTVGKSIKVFSSGKTSVTNPSKDPLIWHHKWQWVGDDYKGFDVAASKARSKQWRDIVGVNKEVSSRIGRKSYWEREIVPKLEPENKIANIRVPAEDAIKDVSSKKSAPSANYRFFKLKDGSIAKIPANRKIEMGTNAEKVNISGAQIVEETPEFIKRHVIKFAPEDIKYEMGIVPRYGELRKLPKGMPQKIQPPNENLVAAKTHITRTDVTQPTKYLEESGWLKGIEGQRVLHHGRGKAFDDTKTMQKYGAKVDEYDFDPELGINDRSILGKGDYDKTVSNYVLNVLPPAERQGAIADIGSSIKPDTGQAFISVRGTGSFPYIKNMKKEFDGFRTSSGSFQKAYTPKELKGELEEHFGEVTILKGSDKSDMITAQARNYKGNALQKVEEPTDIDLPFSSPIPLDKD